MYGLEVVPEKQVSSKNVLSFSIQNLCEVRLELDFPTLSFSHMPCERHADFGSPAGPRGGHVKAVVAEVLVQKIACSKRFEVQARIERSRYDVFCAQAQRVIGGAFPKAVLALVHENISSDSCKRSDHPFSGAQSVSETNVAVSKAACSAVVRNIFAVAMNFEIAKRRRAQNINSCIKRIGLEILVSEFEASKEGVFLYASCKNMRVAMQPKKFRKSEVEAMRVLGVNRRGRG